MQEIHNGGGPWIRSTFSLSPRSSNRWLVVRQSTVAQNIANANTPGYKAVDVEPFEAALDQRD